MRDNLKAPKEAIYLLALTLLIVILAILFIYLLSGCISTVHQIPVSRGDDYECVAMLQKADNCQMAGKILAGVGGMSALAAVPDKIPEGGRWTIGAVAATTSVIGVGLIWYGERQEDRFNEVCEYQDIADGGVN